MLEITPLPLLPSTNNANNSSPSGYCLHLHSRGNCSRTCKDTSNQAQAFPHTPPKLHTDQTSPLCKQLRHHCHPLTMTINPSPSGYCFHFNYRKNHSRTHLDTSNQVQAFPLTSKYTNQSNIAISEVITVPLPSTNNAKQSLTTRLLLSL